MAKHKKDIPLGIKVLGVGGSGSNIVNRMYRSRLKGIEFFALNTDLQAIKQINGPKRVQIGKNITQGLGTGMDPELGKKAAEESKGEIEQLVKDSQMVFVTCGMGGGTGSGAGPVVAEIVKNMGILTVAIVTTPFSFEGKLRKEIADRALAELKDKVDTLITISNDRLLSITTKETPLLEAFSFCDDVLKNAINGIAEIILYPGLINVDFADVKTIIKDAGLALMGMASAKGEERAITAARLAIENPLLDFVLTGASGILFCLRGGKNLTLYEVNEAAKIITQNASEGAKIIFGAIIDESLKDEIKITIIAAGFAKTKEEKEERREFIPLTSFKEISRELEKEKTKEEAELEVPAFLRKKIKY